MRDERSGGGSKVCVHHLDKWKMEQREAKLNSKNDSEEAVLWYKEK